MTSREQHERKAKLLKDVSFLFLVAVFGLVVVTFLGVINEMGWTQQRMAAINALDPFYPKPVLIYNTTAQSSYQ